MTELILVGIFIGFNINKEEATFDDDSSESKQVKQENTLSVMIEQTAGAGDYKMETRSTWPTDGYMFNETLSKCENGGELGWDSEKGVVTMTGNMSDKCYVYFDIYIAPNIISDVCSTGSNLASCIKIFGNNGKSSNTNLYHHDGTLENGIDDGSYRYAGGDYVLTSTAIDAGLTELYVKDSSATNGVINFYCNDTKYYVGKKCDVSYTRYFTLQYDINNTQYSTYSEAIDKAVSDGYLTKDNVKNYVCFGSDETICSTDNLYRIIGVFGDQVKLIKYDYATTTQLGIDGDYYAAYSEPRGSDSTMGLNALTSIGAYYWNYKVTESAINTWSTSLLNKTNLNTNYISYLDNIDTKWANMIATTTWKVGGNTYNKIGKVVAKTAYQNEITTPAISSTCNCKIGLMYVSDYGFAASSSAWSTVLSSYNNSSITSVNWMHMGLMEWSITRESDNSYGVFQIGLNGSVGTNGTSVYWTARPAFYLNSDVTYVSGTGTSSDPIRIE